MTSRVTIWLTDRQMERWTALAQAHDLAPHELAGLVVCRAMGKGPKTRDNFLSWVTKQEIRTRRERVRTARRNGSLRSRAEEVLREVGRPLSTPELKERLGNPTRLHDVLSNNPEIFRKSYVPPEGHRRTRGRQPVWWTLE